MLQRIIFSVLSLPNVHDGRKYLKLSLLYDSVIIWKCMRSNVSESIWPKKSPAEWYAAREIASVGHFETPNFQMCIYDRSPVSVSPACGPGTSELSSDELYRRRFFTASTRRWSDTPLGDGKVADSLTMGADTVRDKWLARAKEIPPPWGIAFFTRTGKQIGCYLGSRTSASRKVENRGARADRRRSTELWTLADSELTISSRAKIRASIMPAG